MLIGEHDLNHISRIENRTIGIVTNFEYLERIIVKNGKYIARESIYNPGSRVRDVEVGPQGKIYVALEDPGRIVVLTPAD